MKRGLIICGLLIACFMIIVSCEKMNGEGSGGVELYLLESFETFDESCGIDLSSLVIKDEPLVRYADIKSYDSKDYTFKISETAREKIENLEHSVTGLPFAVTADEEVIYTGYFWPSYSSAICQWIVVDPLMWYGGNKFRVELGYPGLIEGSVIPDERNNNKILDIFRRDKKLID